MSEPAQKPQPIDPPTRTERRDSYLAKRRNDHQASHLQRLSRDYGRKLTQR